MDDNENALIQRMPSEDSVPASATRSSNGKALKVAGLTLLACLLLAGQALTASFIWGQKEHINALTQSQEQLKNQLTRRTSAGAPKVMRLPMNSMPLLMDPDTEVQSTAAAAAELQTRCQLEDMKQVRPGFYAPQCDEQGNYLPMQCWHSTGYCWCVDKNGNEIKGTRIRGRPTCDTE